MATGIVKWFNNAKGYGFITADNMEADIFAHFSAISMHGYKTLKAGQTVNFEMTTGPKGLHALNIQPQPMDDEFEDAAGNMAEAQAQPEVAEAY